MLQNLEAIGCLGAQPSLLTTPLSATQQGDRYHVLTGTADGIPGFLRKLSLIRRWCIDPPMHSTVLFRVVPGNYAFKLAL